MQPAAIREPLKAAVAVVAAIVTIAGIGWLGTGTAQVPAAIKHAAVGGQSTVGEQSIGNTIQVDAHEPRPWLTLSPAQQALFDLGYRVFNTEWVPANSPPGRIDGLGPLFNAQSCDACHNSRRRGRGPREAGEAPADLVVQLGRVSPQRTVIRGSQLYGFVLNTSAISGFEPEGRVSIQYERWHAVPVVQAPEDSSAGAHLFQSMGCADCHRMSLPVDPGEHTPARIHPYTDLLLHTLGDDLADRDLTGAATAEQWRTAPLWGMHAAYISGQPLRLVHDGRARSIEEAILWHAAEGTRSRDNYTRLARLQRIALLQWIESL
jgi:CxxC motif-containing protein (DUF1111 family)